MNITKLLLFPALCLCLGQVSAQPADQLQATIRSLDAALFDSYNRCDVEKFATFFVDDVEFYHDKTGLSVGTKDLVDALRKNICGKVKRELVPGTLEVYPMNGYGAVEIGVHRFRHPGREEVDGVGEAKFIHLWQYKDGAWKITRVISYDHHAAAK